MIHLVSMIGLVATVLSTSILLPSVLKQLRTKKPGQLEPIMVGQVILVNILWTSYGFLNGDVYIFGRALIAGIISVVTLLLYYKYK